MYSYAYIQIKHILLGFRDCRYVLELAVGFGWVGLGGGGALSAELIVFA